MNEPFRWALKRILDMAYGDSGGSRRCAEFLLALWNGETYPVDLQGLLYLDEELFTAMIRVLEHLYHTNTQLDT